MTITRRQLIHRAALTGAVGLTAIEVAGANEQRPSQRKQLLLQIYFQVSKERAAGFEKMYAESYVPALRKQQGYISSNLLRLFSEKVAKEIGAAATEFTYQMQLVFDTEENRRKWVASKEHAQAWPLASGMAEKVAWRGYDVVGSDQQAK